MSNEWNGSRVMARFAEIASKEGLISSNLSSSNKKDFVGNASEDIDVIPRYKETKEYRVSVKSKHGLSDETGKDLIEKAHPKTVELADAQGLGAVVENLLEQQKKDIEVATKMPHGTFIGVHASIIKELTKQANLLEASGNIQAAKKIDNTIKKLTKNAFFITLPTAAIIAAISGGAAAARYGSYFFSSQEGLGTDIGDFLEVLDKVSSDYPKVINLASNLHNILSPFQIKFQQPIPDVKDTKAIESRIKTLQTFGRKLPTISTIIDGMTAGASSWWPFGVRQRLKGQFNTLKESYEVAKKALKAVELVAKQTLSSDNFSANSLGGSGTFNSENNISAVQRVLGIKQSGILDSLTKNKLREIENKLEITFSDIIKKRDLKMKGMLLNGNKVINAAKLKKILNLAQARASIV